VVVNESLVRRFFLTATRWASITYDDPADPQTRWLTIVGIVSDTRRGGVDHAAWAGSTIPLAWRRIDG
jgi:hypothetical protein